MNGTQGSGTNLPNVIAGRGSSSYFNKSGVGAIGSSGIGAQGGLPTLNSGGGIAMNNPKANNFGSYGNFNKAKPGAPGGYGAQPYKYGGMGSAGGDPYNNVY